MRDFAPAGLADGLMCKATSKMLTKNDSYYLPLLPFPPHCPRWYAKEIIHLQQAEEIG